MRKLAFCICKNKDADQLRGNREAKLIRAFVFATRIVQSLFYLNPKFQASSHLLWLHSLVCVGPGQKSGRLVFSQRGSYDRMFSICIVERYKDHQISYYSREGANNMPKLTCISYFSLYYTFTMQSMFTKATTL